MLACFKMARHLASLAPRATAGRGQDSSSCRSGPGAAAGPGPVGRLRAACPHAARPALASRYPVHVVLKLDPSLPNLRGRQPVRVIERCLRTGKERRAFVWCTFRSSRITCNLIVEALGAKALSAGIKGLSVRLARRLNTLLGRKGRVMIERYFGPSCARRRRSAGVCATCCSIGGGMTRSAGGLGTGAGRSLFVRSLLRRLARGRATPPPPEERCVSPPRLWLLTTGWRSRGLISVDAVPGPAA